MNDKNNLSATSEFPWKRGLLPSLGAMLVVFVLFMLGGVVTELLFGISVAVLGADAAAFVKANMSLVLSIVSFAGYIVGSTMCVMFLKRICKADSAMTLVRGRWSDVQGNLLNTVKWAVIGFFAVHFLDALYMLLPLPTPKVPSSEAASHMTGLALVIFSLGASFLGPIYEEIICRGFIFNMLRSTFSQRWAKGTATVLAMLLSAAFFSAFHLTLSAFVPLFFFGLIAAEVYRRTGNIYAPMLMHFFNNALVSIIFLVNMH